MADPVFVGEALSKAGKVLKFIFSNWTKILNEINTFFSKEPFNERLSEVLCDIQNNIHPCIIRERICSILREELVESTQMPESNYYQFSSEIIIELKKIFVRSEEDCDKILTDIKNKKYPGMIAEKVGSVLLSEMRMVKNKSNIAFYKHTVKLITVLNNSFRFVYKIWSDRIYI